MSVITLSTVGFGDYDADTQGGQLFGAFWMLLGVAAMANFVGALAKYLQGARQELAKAKVTNELFAKYDADGSNTLDKMEFLRLQLEMNSLVAGDIIDDIMRQFDLIDTSQDGEISMDEVKAYYGPAKGQ
mmetsp:Transcript_75961/g.234458  ORF Transcript_75961/g.234458 Transcript_75961/m.234458 type:complete len:130 (-) Transcript_75961:34-423(-)